MEYKVTDGQTILILREKNPIDTNVSLFVRSTDI